MVRARQAVGALCLVAALLLGVLAVPALSTPSASRATCTPAQHAKNVKALASYRKQMAKQRVAYFRTHTSPKLRAKFVKTQQARLAALKKAAGCRVVIASTTTRSTTTSTRSTTTTTPLPALGTRQNPYPLGAMVTLGDKWSVKVTAVYPDATAAILAANMFNKPPKAGDVFFMVAVQATYNGTGSAHLDSGFRFRAVGASNVGYTTFNNSCGVLPEPDLYLTDPEVFTGGTVSGNAACWEIPASDAASLVMYDHPLLSTAPDLFLALH